MPSRGLGVLHAQRCISVILRSHNYIIIITRNIKKCNSNDNSTENNNGPCLEGGVEDMLNEASPRLPNFTFNGVHNVNYFKSQASGKARGGHHLVCSRVEK